MWGNQSYIYLFVELPDVLPLLPPGEQIGELHRLAPGPHQLRRGPPGPVEEPPATTIEQNVVNTTGHVCSVAKF